MPKHTPVTDVALELYEHAAGLKSEFAPAYRLLRTINEIREARRLLRALCNETRGTISLNRAGLMGLVGVTNVRVLERKMFEASDYLAACEGAKREE